MTEQERKDAALKLYTDLDDTMCNLRARWQEEKEHEDINDYAKPIRSTIEAAGGSIIRMMKRPFGVKFTLGDATYQITVGRHYAYKRIK